VFQTDKQGRKHFADFCTVFLPLAFIGFGTLATVHVVGSIEFNLRCVITIDEIWITRAVPVIDFILSLCFMLLFLVPMRQIAAANKNAINSPAAHGSFTILIKETMRLALAQIFISAMSLVGVATGGVVVGPFGLFSDSFLSVDLLANSLVQLYATRRVWGIKSYHHSDAGDSSNGSFVGDFMRMTGKPNIRKKGQKAHKTSEGSEALQLTGTIDLDSPNTSLSKRTDMKKLSQPLLEE